VGEGLGEGQAYGAHLVPDEEVDVGDLVPLADEGLPYEVGSLGVGLVGAESVDGGPHGLAHGAEASLLHEALQEPVLLLGDPSGCPHEALVFAHKRNRL